MRSTKKHFLRLFSSFLILTFVCEQLGFAAGDLKAFRLSAEGEKVKLSYSIPESVARIEDSYKAPASTKTVFLLQDAHTNESGQLNLAKTIDTLLANEKDLHTVYAEAAVGDNSLAFLRSAKPLKERTELARTYIRKGLLHGVEYLDLTSDRDFAVWGVENPELYIRSLEQYRTVAKDRERFELYLKKIRSTYETLSNRLVSPTLKSLLDKSEMFEAGSLPLTDYFDRLSTEASKYSVDMGAFRSLSLLRDLKTRESKLDFKKANEEEALAIQTLSVEDRKILIEASMKAGASTFSGGMEDPQQGYFAMLEEKLAGHLADYPELFAYFDYLKSARNIDAVRVLSELKGLEQKLTETMALSPDEKMFASASRMIGLYDKLFRLTLTPADHQEYQALKAKLDIEHLTGFFNKKIMDLGTYYDRSLFLEKGYEGILKSCETFYSLTTERDENFVKEMTRKMDEKGETKAALISGGFHTVNLKALLKQKGISFVSLTPQVLRETNLAKYESTLLGQFRPQMAVGMRSAASTLDFLVTMTRAGDVVSQFRGVIKAPGILSEFDQTAKQGARLSTAMQVVNIEAGEANAMTGVVLAITVEDPQRVKLTKWYSVAVKDAYDILKNLDGTKHRINLALKDPFLKNIGALPTVDAVVFSVLGPRTQEVTDWKTGSGDSSQGARLAQNKKDIDGAALQLEAVIQLLEDGDAKQKALAALGKLKNNEIKLSFDEMAVYDGDWKEIGSVDIALGLEAGLNHRTVDVLPVLPDGRFAMQQRTHNATKEPDTYSLTGGYVQAGETELQAVRRILMQELGMTVSASQYNGTLVPFEISASEIFPSELGKKRDLFVYYLSQREKTQVEYQTDGLKSKMLVGKREDYRNFIESVQATTGVMDVQDVAFLTLEELLKMNDPANPLKLEKAYFKKIERIRAKPSTDTLKPLLELPGIKQLLKNISQEAVTPSSGARLATEEAPTAITGGRGFLGAYLRPLFENPRLLSRQAPSKRVAEPPSNTVFIEGDVSDQSAIEKLVEGAGTVINMAAVSNSEALRNGPVASLKVSIGTARLMQTADKARMVLHTSTQSVEQFILPYITPDSPEYNAEVEQWIENAATAFRTRAASGDLSLTDEEYATQYLANNPIPDVVARSIYPLLKAVEERLVTHSPHNNGLVVRLPMMYGDGDYFSENRMSKIVQLFMFDEPIGYPLYSDQARDVLYVEDAAKILKAITLSEKPLDELSADRILELRPPAKNSNGNLVGNATNRQVVQVLEELRGQKIGSLLERIARRSGTKAVDPWSTDAVRFPSQSPVVAKQIIDILPEIGLEGFEWTPLYDGLKKTVGNRLFLKDVRGSISNDEVSRLVKDSKPPKQVMDNPGSPKIRQRKTLLVTGGAGFMMNLLINYYLHVHPEFDILVVDNFSSGTPESFIGQLGGPHESRVRVFKGDINDSRLMAKLVSLSDRVIHGAAESKVDRSYRNDSLFIRTNVDGSRSVGEAVAIEKAHRKKQGGKDIRMIHISTDEVSGGSKSSYSDENAPTNPQNPYAVSKRDGALEVADLNKEQGLEAITVNPTNNYEQQHMMNLIPNAILFRLLDLPAPLFGDPIFGDPNKTRDWLNAWDFARAIDLLLEKGGKGEVYNIAGRQERGLEDTLLKLMDQTEKSRHSSEDAFKKGLIVKFANNRPINDEGYRINDQKLRDLGFFNVMADFDKSLERIWQWYNRHPEWLIARMTSPDEDSEYFEPDFKEYLEKILKQYPNFLKLTKMRIQAYAGANGKIRFAQPIPPAGMTQEEYGAYVEEWASEWVQKGEPGAEGARLAQVPDDPVMAYVQKVLANPYDPNNSAAMFVVAVSMIQLRPLAAALEVWKASGNPNVMELQEFLVAAYEQVNRIYRDSPLGMTGNVAEMVAAFQELQASFIPKDPSDKEDDSKGARLASAGKLLAAAALLAIVSFAAPSYGTTISPVQNVPAAGGQVLTDSVLITIIPSNNEAPDNVFERVLEERLGRNALNAEIVAFRNDVQGRNNIPDMDRVLRRGEPITLEIPLRLEIRLPGTDAYTIELDRNALGAIITEGERVLPETIVLPNETTRDTVVAPEQDTPAPAQPAIQPGQAIEEAEPEPTRVEEADAADEGAAQTDWFREIVFNREYAGPFAIIIGFVGAFCFFLIWTFGFGPIRNVYRRLHDLSEKGVRTLDGKPITKFIADEVSDTLVKGIFKGKKAKLRLSGTPVFVTKDVDGAPVIQGTLDQAVADYLKLPYVTERPKSIPAESSRLTAEQEAALKKVEEVYGPSVATYERIALLYFSRAKDADFTEVDSKYVAEKPDVFPKTSVNDILGDATLIKRAKSAQVEVLSLDGGLGEKLRRAVWKTWLSLKGLLSAAETILGPDGTPKLGAKGTDMGYFVRTADGVIRYISVSESKLLQLYYQGTAGKFKKLSFRPIVNIDSQPSYEALVEKPNILGIKMDGESEPMSYRALLELVGVTIEPFMFQPDVPGLSKESAQDGAITLMPGATLEAQHQSGGHGQIGIEIIASPETIDLPKDGSPMILAFTNGDNQVASDITPEVVGHILKNKFAIGNLVTMATPADRKGGKYIVRLMEFFGLRRWMPGQREVAAAKELGADAEKNFYAAGQAEGKDLFGESSVGNQPFNTNNFYINMTRLVPFLRDLKVAIGQDRYLAEVISPNFMQKDTKKGKDGKEYYPVDSAIGNVFHNLNEFVLKVNLVAPLLVIAARKTEAQRTEIERKLLLEYGAALNVIKSHKMDSIIHYYDVPGRMFTPQKNPIDALRQMAGQYYELDLETGRLEETRGGLQPAEFTIIDSDGNSHDSGKGYYSEFMNMLRTFISSEEPDGILTSAFDIRDLEKLEIRGNILLQDAVLAGDVKITSQNKTAPAFNLRAAILRDPELKNQVGYEEGSPLTIKDKDILIDEDGRVHMTANRTPAIADSEPSPSKGSGPPAQAAASKERALVITGLKAIGIITAVTGLAVASILGIIPVIGAISIGLVAFIIFVATLKGEKKSEKAATQAEPIPDQAAELERKILALDGRLENGEDGSLDEGQPRWGWIHRGEEVLKSRMPEEAEAEVARLRAAGIEAVGVIGMGGEASIVGPSDEAVDVISSTSPAKIDRLLSGRDLSKMHWFIVSKSGGTTETLENAKHLIQLYIAAGLDPADYITIVTDIPKDNELSNKLIKTVRELQVGKEFRVLSRELNGQTSIGGRNTLMNWPTLLVYGWRMNAEKNPGVVREMVQAVVDAHDPAKREAGTADPWIAAAIQAGELSKQGRNKLYIKQPEWMRKDQWVWEEQVFEESLAKAGKGFTVYTSVPDGAVLDNTWVILDLTGAVRAAEDSSGPVTISVNISYENQAHAQRVTAYGLMKMIAAMGFVLNVNVSTQEPVESYKKLMRTELSLDEVVSGAGKYVVLANRLTLVFDGVIPLISEENRVKIDTLLEKPNANPSEVYRGIWAILRSEKVLDAQTLAFYDDVDPATAAWLDTLAETQWLKNGIITKWGEGSGVLHGNFVGWFSGPMHQVPVHIVSKAHKQLTPDYTEGSKVLVKSAAAAHKSLVEGGRPSILLIADEAITTGQPGRKRLEDFFSTTEMLKKTASLATRQEELIKKYLNSELKESDKKIILEMLRDYDYRMRANVTLSPKAWFLFGVAWGLMAKEQATKTGDTNRDWVLARDARKVEPELIEAMAAGLSYVGFNVIYVAAEGPNAVTSYSWAVREFSPIGATFLTASHVKAPLDIVIRGAKTSIKNEDGELASLSTKEIKEDSNIILQALIDDSSYLRSAEAKLHGVILDRNVDLNTTRANAIVGRVAAGLGNGLNLAQLSTEFKVGNILETLARLESEVGTDSTPLKGLSIVVDGVQTPSGYLTQRAFEALGAKVVLIHGDVQEIEGEHKADPSIPANLEELKRVMTEKNIQFGMSFDLDGDRGAIIVRKPDGEFVTLPPDNIMAAMIPFLQNEGGYSVFNKVAYVRDTLSSASVDRAASDSKAESKVTDAGYVFLKDEARKLRFEDYRIPAMGERSGHAWLEVTGDYENPVAVGLVFAIMALKYAAGNPKSTTPYWDVFQSSTAPYIQSARFQPAFHPEFLERLSTDEMNDTGWTWSRASGDKASPNQRIIAIGRHRTVSNAMEHFAVGSSHETPFGLLTVREVIYQEPATSPDGLYRYADIRFVDKDGLDAGRFIIRASSNDPTFVVSYETPVRVGESAEQTRLRYISVGGLVMDYLQTSEKFFDLTSESVKGQEKTEGQILMEFQRLMAGSQASAQTLVLVSEEDGSKPGFDETQDFRQTAQNEGFDPLQAFVYGGFMDRLRDSKRFEGAYVSGTKLEAAVRAIAAINADTNSERIFEILSLVNTSGILSDLTLDEGVQAIHGIALTIKEEMEAGRPRAEIFRSGNIVPEVESRLTLAIQMNPIRDMIQKSRADLADNAGVQLPKTQAVTPDRSVKRGWTKDQMDLINTAIRILRQSGLSEVPKDIQNYLNGEIDVLYKKFLDSNRNGEGVLPEEVSDLTSGIHNSYVASQRGPKFILYDQEMHDAVYLAIQEELKDKSEGMEHAKSSKEGNLTLALFLDPGKKWQLRLEHFKSSQAQGIIKDALMARGIVEEELGEVTINTLNNDYDVLAKLKVEGSAWSQAKRKEFLAGLQAVGMKEVLMILNDTGTVQELVDSIERGDQEAKEIAAVKLLAIIRILHIIKMLEGIHLTWSLGNSWDPKAELPFSIAEGALGFEDIMLDSHIFVGMFEQLLKGGIKYDQVPDVGISFKKLAGHKKEVLRLFRDRKALETGMVRLDAAPFIEQSGLNIQQQDQLRLTDLVVANESYLWEVSASKEQNQGVVLLGASAPVSNSAETPPLHKDIYDALASAMGFRDWRAAYEDLGIPVVEKAAGQSPEDVTNARTAEFLARLIQQNKKMVMLMPTNVASHAYVGKELELLLDTKQNYALLEELKSLKVEDPQKALEKYLATNVTFIFGMRALLEKKAPSALTLEELASFFASIKSEPLSGARLAMYPSREDLKPAIDILNQLDLDIFFTTSRSDELESAWKLIRQAATKLETTLFWKDVDASSTLLTNAITSLNGTEQDIIGTVQRAQGALPKGARLADLKNVNAATIQEAAGLLLDDYPDAKIAVYTSAEEPKIFDGTNATELEAFLIAQYGPEKKYNSTLNAAPSVQMNVAPVTDRKSIGTGLEVLAPLASPAREVAIDWMGTLYDPSKGELMAGARELLMELYVNKIKVWIITMVSAEDLQEILKRPDIDLNIGELVAGVHGEDGVTQGKSGHLRNIAAAAASNPGELVMIGDSASDMSEARKAGVPGIALVYHLTDPLEIPNFKPAKPAAIVEGFNGFSPALKNQIINFLNGPASGARLATYEEAVKAITDLLEAKLPNDGLRVSVPGFETTVPKMFAARRGPVGSAKGALKAMTSVNFTITRTEDSLTIALAGARLALANSAGYNAVSQFASSVRAQEETELDKFLAQPEVQQFIARSLAAQGKNGQKAQQSENIALLLGENILGIFAAEYNSQTEKLKLSLREGGHGSIEVNFESLTTLGNRVTEAKVKLTAQDFIWMIKQLALSETLALGDLANIDTPVIEQYDFAAFGDDVYTDTTYLDYFLFQAFAANRRPTGRKIYYEFSKDELALVEERIEAFSEDFPEIAKSLTEIMHRKAPSDAPVVHIKPLGSKFTPTDNHYVIYTRVPNRNNGEFMVYPIELAAAAGRMNLKKDGTVQDNFRDAYRVRLGKDVASDVLKKALLGLADAGIYDEIALGAIAALEIDVFVQGARMAMKVLGSSA